MLARLLSLALTAVPISDQMTVYPLVEASANQGWKVELFELCGLASQHYHKVQRQIILVAQGQLQVYNGCAEPMMLTDSECAIIEPGSVHALNPKGTAWFFAIDVPGFTFPEDVYFTDSWETSSARPWTPLEPSEPPVLSASCFKKSTAHVGYTSYELLSLEATQGKVGVDLLELEKAGKGVLFSRPGKAHLIVVGGQIHLELDGKSRKLGAGEMVTIQAQQPFVLSSSLDLPARVLCFQWASNS